MSQEAELQARLKEKLREWRHPVHGLPAYARDCLKILNKEGKLAPLEFNDAQWMLHERIEAQRANIGMVRLVGLKGRRQGFSTYVAARFYWKAALNFGRKVYILSHEKKSAQALFGMVDRYQRYNPFAPSVGTDNAQMLTFPELEGSYVVATAGAQEGGRGDDVNLFHGCLSPDTWIMTPDRRLKRMGDFQIGDMVLTHTNVVAPVSFISRQRKHALSVKMLGCSEPIVATPEHKFWTKAGMTPLGDLKVGDYLAHPVPELHNHDLPWPYRLDYGSRTRGAMQTGGVASVGPDYLVADFNLGRVLGLYLAEGTIIRQSNGGKPSAVSFAVHHKEVERTVKWLEPFRHCWRSAPKVAYRDDCLTATVTVYSRSFAEFVLARCGAKDDKALPLGWELNRDFAHGLVVGYFSGDGGGTMDASTRRVQAPSIRAAITVGMRDALAALGYGWPTIAYREGGFRSGRVEQAQWTIRVSGVGADRLWAEMGREPLPRTRKARENNIRIENGYAWLPITSIEDVGEVEVMDFEVDHDDHSYRTLQCAVSNSEAAFWQNAEGHFAASLQCVALLPGTEIILESTSAGPSGKFYETFRKGETGTDLYESVFVPWHVQKEYFFPPEANFTLDTIAPDEHNAAEVDVAKAYSLNNGQMKWRRLKIAELGLARFNREYPSCPDDAWSSIETDTFINPAAVLRARGRDTEPSGPLIMGVDPAGGGGDRFAVCMRQGNAVVFLQWRNKIDSLEATEWLASLVDEHNPDRVNIDAGNIGQAIVTNLRAKGPKYANLVRSVSFGSPSSIKLADKTKVGPENRRAEMWGRLKEWIEDREGCASIPNLDDLSSDLVAPKQIFRIDGDWLLMSKSDMKKAGLRSPDLGDALALTFASKEYFPERAPATISRDAAVGAYSSAPVDDYGPVGEGGWMI